MAIEPTNPDLVALGTLKEALRDLTIAWPDGGTGHFDHIDIGYMSKPTAYPYVSLHTNGSSAPVRHLGRGANKEARGFAIDAIIEIEYEHPDAEIGFARLTQLRWDVFRFLIEQNRLGTGVEYAELEDAHFQVVLPDEGDFQDWGFFGQILIPITIHLKGAAV